MCRRIIILCILIVTIIYGSLNITFDNLIDTKYIDVEVKGDNITSKIITLPLGSTLNDLINILQTNNDIETSCLSLNEVLYNHQIITFTNDSSSDLISINNADINTLCSLPGIGQSIAKNIIEYRNTYGSFVCLDELKNVNGIGDKKYEKLKQYICL